MKERRTRITTIVRLFLLFLVASSYGYSQLKGRAEDGFATAYRMPLTDRENGVQGYLELRQDARLSAKLKQSLWQTGDINLDDNPALAMLKTEPLHPAMVQVVDQAGRVLEVKRLERPLARLGKVQMYGDSRLTYLLTVDYSAGFGSYSGPITSLMEVKSGHLQQVKATEAKTGSQQEIGLMSSLKTTWKIVDAPAGNGKQILLARCRPDFSSASKDDAQFTTTYARYSFDGKKWMVVERTEKGLSEFEQGFPIRKLFP